MTTLSSQTRPARLALAVPLSLAALALAACGSDPAAPTTDTVSDPAPSSPASSEATSEAPSPTASPEEARLISYEDADSVGTRVTSRADAKRLEGAPAAFQDFVGRTAERAAQEADCPGTERGVTVDLLRTDGFAVGSVHGCDAYIALWADVDGTWTEIQSTLDLWSCGVLEEHAVPADIAGTVCYDRKTRQQRDYAQA